MKMRIHHPYIWIVVRCFGVLGAQPDLEVDRTPRVTFLIIQRINRTAHRILGEKPVNPLDDLKVNKLNGKSAVPPAINAETALEDTQDNTFIYLNFGLGQ